MKFLASFSVFIGLLPSSDAALAANRTMSLPHGGLLLYGGGGALSLEQVSRIMRTEVSNIQANAKDPVQAWDNLLEAERNRFLTSGATLTAKNLRRSILRQDEPVTPFLVCDVEQGVSGQVRKQLLSDMLGSDQLMNLYNKDDMSCFALQSTVSDLHHLPENVQSVPILPEMKIPHGTMDAIEASEINFGRVEAILCPGVQDLDAALAAIKQAVKEPHVGGRALRVHDFADSRLQVDDDTSHQWQRIMTGETPSCDEMTAALGVDSFDDTIMFAISPSFRGTEWRTCLQMLVIDLSLHDDVCFVGAYEDPQIFNDIASGILQSGSAESKPLYDVGLDGSGQVVGVADSGIDVDNCYFFDSIQSTPKSSTGSVTGPVNSRARKVVQYVAFGDDSDYSGGHGTHVAGSIAGRRSTNGRDEQTGEGDGVARAAKLAFFDISESNNGLRVPLLSTMFATGYNDAGARVYSASWGNTNLNSYSSFDHQADSFMYKNPDFLFVVAAGNSGRDRPSKSIATPGLNKNGITVGASQSSSPRNKAGMLGPGYLAEFSSRGPTQDGRRKPDIVAPGMYIQSARARPDTQGECDDSEGLVFKSGTSMATPLVSGTAALIRQYFEEGWHASGEANPSEGFSPRASLVKAVIVNGAVELQGLQDDQTGHVTELAAYDMNQGFGRVNLLKSLPIAGKNDIKGVFINSRNISTGGTHKFDVLISHDNSCSEPLSVSLVWSDPPVGPMCEESCVLNDLDLSLTATKGGVTFYPNGLSKPDDKNNVERIRLEKPQGGSRYTVQVKGTQLIEPQTYSLAITGCLASPDANPAPTAMPKLPPTPKPVATASPTAVPTTSPEKLGAAAGDCADTAGVFKVEGVNRKCSWLAGKDANRIKFLCHWLDVAQTCPSTCQACQAQNSGIGEIETTAPRLDGTVRYYGNAFEIQTHYDIRLMSFGVHLFGSSTVSVEVWIRKDMSSSDKQWTQMCSSSVVGKGRYEIVMLPDGDCTPTELAAGTTAEIYVAIESSKDIIMIADKTWTFETEDFSLLNGAAVSYFDDKRLNGYGFDGSIKYARSCKDKESTVYFSDWVGGNKSCLWLAKNLDRMGFSCEFTDIVLHCPSTCGHCTA